MVQLISSSIICGRAPLSDGATPAPAADTSDGVANYKIKTKWKLKKKSITRGEDKTIEPSKLLTENEYEGDLLFIII